MRLTPVLTFLVYLAFLSSMHADGMIGYMASIEPIGDSTVSGTAVVVTMQDGSLFYGGSITGLEANLEASSCDATNGCGFHIHSGSSCEDTVSQEGHYYENLDDDPWVTAQYSSDADGEAMVGELIDIGTTDVSGRAFLVHAEDGSRIGCGLLKNATGVSRASLISIFFGYEGNAMTVGLTDDTICYAGSSFGLVSLANNITECNPVEVENGCGTHIHIGGCDTTVLQGGHWYSSNNSDTDPWALMGYSTPNETGAANYGGCLKTGFPAADAVGKAFIVHEKDGSRSMCGALRKESDIDYTSGTYIANLCATIFVAVGVSLALW